MSTPILNIAELANGQVDQYLTANEAFRDLEAAANAVVAIDLSGGDETLTLEQLRGAGMFVCSGHTVARVLTVPALTRFFCVANGGTDDVDVTVGSTAITVTAGAMRAFFADGTTDGLFVAQ